MASVRRTISMPAALAARLDAEAEQRGTSFSALVVSLVERSPHKLAYAGLIDDDADLALTIEEVLSRLGR